VKIEGGCSFQLKSIQREFDVFREILRIPNTSDEEKRRIYISLAKIEGGCSFRLKSIQRFSKQS